MAGGGSDDGSIGDLPWAAVFDPAANARAFGAIQARGFRAATEVVDRLVNLIDGNGHTNGRAASSPASHDTNDRTRSSPDVERLVSSWETIVGRLVESLRGGLTPTEVATLDLAKSDANGSVSLEIAKNGRASTVVWLHNAGPKDLGLVRLRCSDLLAAHGGVVDSKTVRFDPESIPIPARSSRGVCVEIHAAQGVQPGIYRGTLLAPEHPDLWLPVVLNVPARES